MDAEDTSHETGESLTIIHLTPDKMWYVKKDGVNSYWLCHETNDDEMEDYHSSCTRIDYRLFVALIEWRSRRTGPCRHRWDKTGVCYYCGELKVMVGGQ